MVHINMVCPAAVGEVRPALQTPAWGGPMLGCQVKVTSSRVLLQALLWRNTPPLYFSLYMYMMALLWG